MSNPHVDAVLAAADRSSIWVPWYFKRGALTLLTAPLFLFLAFCIVTSAFGAALQEVALLRASHAVFGILGGGIAFLFGWIPIALPPILYFSLVKAFPTLWLRPDASVRQRVAWSLLVLILLPLLAFLVFHGVASGIGWIADHDPCSAIGAGITGSRPPLGCS